MNTYSFDNVLLNRVALVVAPLFLLAPFWTIVLLVSVLLIGKYKPMGILNLLILLLSLFLGVINSTKLPQSDLGGYLVRYDMVPQFSLWEYTFKSFGNMAREPVYNFITYLGYYLSVGSFSIYIFLLTAIGYYLQFIAIKKYFTHQKLGISALVTALLLLAFFIPNFSLSAHLVRQFLAVSIFVYVMVQKTTSRKTNWWLLALAVFIHSSIAFFVPFFFIKSLLSQIKVKSTVQLIIIVVSAIMYGAIASAFLAKVLSFSSSLSYVFVRASQTDAFNDGGMMKQSLLNYFLVPLLLLALVQLYLYKGRVAQYFLLNVFVLLGFFILASRTNPLLQYRYFFFAYSFLPFVIVPLIKRNNQIYIAYCMGLSVFVIAWFYTGFSEISWVYAPKFDIFFLDFISLITTKYYQ